MPSKSRQSYASYQQHGLINDTPKPKPRKKPKIKRTTPTAPSANASATAKARSHGRRGAAMKRAAATRKKR